MGFLYTFQSYVKHYFKAVDEHGVHSPFVFELVEDVFDPASYYIFEVIEALRGILMVTDKSINITDFGAGSNFGNAHKKPIRKIARHALSPPEDLQMIYRLIKHLQLQNIVEIGTSLGISSAYLASAVSPASMYTLEGCKETAKVAQMNWKKLGIDNIKLIEGEFSKTLPETLTRLERVDLVYFDGNHRYEPTMEYYNLCIEKADENSVFIFDDIYWSREMTKAWNEIKTRQEVTLTIDLFNLGIVFFRSKQPKQHFRIKRKVLK